jgi:hypothetical protein
MIQLIFIKDEIQRREQFYHELIQKSELVKADKLLTENSQINIHLKYDDRIECLSNLKYITGLSSILKHERYLQCNAKTPIRVLLKLIRNKYDISNKYQIRIRYMDQELEENETILEICICFMLSRVSRE